MIENIKRLLSSPNNTDKRIGLELLANNITSEMMPKDGRIVYLREFRTGYGKENWGRCDIWVVMKGDFMLNVGRDHVVFCRRGSKHYSDMLICSKEKNITRL